MNLASIILEIRKENGLTQEDFADKLFVSRQAVSRWENGETTPAIDTLRKISEMFGIDANAFFGKEPPVCQSCAMPLKSVEDLGSNSDASANMEYCNYCFSGGRFTHDRTVDEMIESNLKFLDEFNAGNGTNYTEDEARAILKMHLATLKRWKKN